MERFIVIGTNHKFAPLEVRERLVFSNQVQPLALRQLSQEHGLDETFLLSTCNRIEFLTFSELEQEDVFARFMSFLEKFHHLDMGPFKEYFYLHRGSQAVEHIFKVAASLDSLVLGETQILNQLKSAYEVAASEGATKKALNSLFREAVTSAKQVHGQTKISQGQSSIPSVAVSFIKRTFDELERKQVLLLGLGEMGRLALRHLKDAGVGKIIIVNRTLAKAQALAEEFQGEAVPFNLLVDYLPKADVVISQTSAKNTLIHKEEVARALKQRSYKPMFFIDLAVPRDIQPEVDQLDGAYRYEIDDLQKVVAEASEARLKEVERCREILKGNVQSFIQNFRTFRVDPLIARIRKQTETLIEQEFAKSSSQLNQLSEEQRKEVYYIARRITKKLLHQPIQMLKDEARKAQHESSSRLEFANDMLNWNTLLSRGQNSSAENDAEQKAQALAEEVSHKKTKGGA